MAVVFGGCAFVCCCGLCCAFASRKAEDSESFVKLGTTCSSCLIIVAILVMYVWGIVVIANKEVDAPWKDYKGKDIMCPLIG